MGHAHTLIQTGMYEIPLLRRSAASLQVMVDRVVEELLEAQNTGLKITDYSLPEHDPDRIFKLKLILLMAVGDYPAQGKLTNFLHCGVRPCHWCNMDFKFHLPGHNTNNNHRSLLTNHHWMREHVGFGPRVPADDPEYANTQCQRTHTGVQEDVQVSENCGLPKTSKKHPRLQTGIDGPCSLSLLALFDMVYDVLPDLMHIDAGVFKARIMQLLKGEFFPKRPTSLGNTYKLRGEQVMYTDAEMVIRTRRNKTMTKRFHAATKVQMMFDMRYSIVIDMEVLYACSLNCAFVNARVCMYAVKCTSTCHDYAHRAHYMHEDEHTY